MIERGGDPAKALNHRWEVDMDFCDKSHKMNSPPELRIKNSQRNYQVIEMKRRPKLDKGFDMEKQNIQPM